MHIVYGNPAPAAWLYMLLPFDQIERLLSRWDHGAWVCYITGIETV